MAFSAKMNDHLSAALCPHSNRTPNAQYVIDEWNLSIEQQSTFCFKKFTRPKTLVYNSTNMNSSLGKPIHFENIIRLESEFIEIFNEVSQLCIQILFCNIQLSETKFTQYSNHKAMHLLSIVPMTKNPTNWLELTKSLNIDAARNSKWKYVQ